MPPRRTALITGVSRDRGLGFAVARALAEAGCRVLVTARSLERAAALAGTLDAGGRDVGALQLDVTDQESVERAVRAAGERFGPIDILINNAAGGFDPDHSVGALDVDTLTQALEVNLVGVWRTCSAVLPGMRRRAYGRIVNVTSEAASFGSPHGLRNPFLGEHLPAYSVSKAALNAYTCKLAHGLAGTGILVNAVCPGQTATHPETGDEDGGRAPSESAAGIVWAATLPADDPTGGFFRDGKPLPW